MNLGSTLCTDQVKKLNRIEYNRELIKHKLILICCDYAKINGIAYCIVQIANGTRDPKMVDGMLMG